MHRTGALYGLEKTRRALASALPTWDEVDLAVGAILVNAFKSLSKKRRTEALSLLARLVPTEGTQ